MPILIIIIAAAFFVTFVGFLVSLGLWVHADAKVRTDNATWWTMVALLAPAGMGLVFYLTSGRDKSVESPGTHKKLMIGFAVAFALTAVLHIGVLALGVMGVISV